MSESWSLAPLALPDDLEDFPQEQALLKKLVDDFHRNQGASLAWRLKCYEALDLRFDALESAVTLKLIESSNDPLFAQLQGALLELEDILIEKTSGLIDEALGALTDNVNEPAWLTALLCGNEDNSIMALHENGFANWLSPDVLSKRILHSKRQTDGSPEVLEQRLSEFQNKEDVSWQLSDGACSAFAQDYFNQILSSVNINLGSLISLKQLRQIERAPWAELKFSLSEGVKVVSEAFASLDVRYEQRVLQAYTEGRIRLLKQGEPSMCMDTPAGSYIQLTYLNDLESLVLLAHECGHLIHQETVRERYILKQDISPLLSEAIALFFENHVASFWLENHGLSDVLTKWQKRQEIEWYHRHQLLARFECQLYGLKDLNYETATALWQRLNQGFYPKQVEFDHAFLSSWQELTHIINSPFYYLIYPQAYSMTNDMDIKEAITQCRYY